LPPAAARRRQSAVPLKSRGGDWVAFLMRDTGGDQARSSPKNQHPGCCLADPLAFGGRQVSLRSLPSYAGKAQATRPVPVCQMPPRLAVAAWHSTCLQPLFQQLDEHRRRFHLLLGWNVLDDGQHRTFDQHTKHCVGICTDLACHADRLGEDVHRVRSTGGNPLNPADERFDSWEGSVWHWDNIARLWAVRQEHGSLCWQVVATLGPWSGHRRLAASHYRSHTREVQREGRQTMLYELRIYECVPGRLPDLNKRFSTITLKIWERHGIKQAGFWTTVIGESNQTLYYMLQWDSLADREKKWNAFQADPEWHAARAKTEEAGAIVANVKNFILGPTPYSSVQ
jgi:hypothetical protein